MNVKEVAREDVDWIQLPQDSDQWRIIVSTATKSPVPQEVKESPDQ
jgi:hypothetical protein